MIVIIALTLLAVAGIITTRIVWVRIDESEKERVADREQLLILIESIRVELHEAIAAVVRDAAHMRQTHNGDYADLLQKYTVLNDDLNSLLDFFNAEEFAGVFRAQIGQTFRMRLPDTLKLRLGGVRER